MAFIFSGAMPVSEGTCPVTGAPVRTMTSSAQVPVLYSTDDCQLYNGSLRGYADMLVPGLGEEYDGQLVSAEVASALRHAGVRLRELFDGDAVNGVRYGEIIRSYARDALRRAYEALPMSVPRWNPEERTKPHYAKAMEDFFAEGIDVLHRERAQDWASSHQRFDACAPGELSTREAARTLSDALRTRRFIEALDRSVRDMLEKFPEGPIRVVDAGCGPYPLFGVWAALMDDRVESVCIESQPFSVEIARAVVRKLGLEQRVAVVHVDALVCNPGPVHVLISETMNVAFATEQITAILPALAQYVVPEGHIIPNEVRVAWQLVPRDAYERPADGFVVGHDALWPDLGDRSYNIATTLKPQKGVRGEPLAEVRINLGTIPQEIATEPHYLVLGTEVDLYEGIGLKVGDSMITHPFVPAISMVPGVRLLQLHPDIAGRTMEITYTPGNLYSTLKWAVDGREYWNMAA